MEYWTIIDDRHAGPYSADELIGMGITPESPVWTSGLPDWVEASEIEELRLLLQARDAIPAAGTVPPDPAPQPVTDPAAQECRPSSVSDPYSGMQQPGMEQPGMPAQTFQPLPEPGPFVPAEPQWEWQREAVIPDEPCPPAYLVWSIIVTILCCQPLGIAAIICSAQTRQAYNRGNMAKARKMSEWAQWLIIISIVTGLVGLPVQLAFLGV